MKRLMGSGIFLLLSLSLLGAGKPPADPVTYRGTVHAFSARTGELDLVTGVGMAMRIVRIQTTAATRISTGRSGPTSAQLQRGDILRVDCHRTGDAFLADRITNVGVS